MYVCLYILYLDFYLLLAFCSIYCFLSTIYISINLFIVSGFSVMVDRKPSYKEIHPYYLLGFVEFIVSIWTTASFGVYSYVCCMEFILFFPSLFFSNCCSTI